VKAGRKQEHHDAAVGTVAAVALGRHAGEGLGLRRREQQDRVELAAALIVGLAAGVGPAADEVGLADDEGPAVGVGTQRIHVRGEDVAPAG